MKINDKWWAKILKRDKSVSYYIYTNLCNHTNLTKIFSRCYKAMCLLLNMLTGRECPHKKSFSNNDEILQGSVSLCHHVKEPLWTPLLHHLLLIVLSPFSHSQWSMGISHHDLISPITKSSKAWLPSTQQAVILEFSTSCEI